MKVSAGKAETAKHPWCEVTPSGLDKRLCAEIADKVRSHFPAGLRRTGLRQVCRFCWYYRHVQHHSLAFRMPRKLFILVRLTIYFGFPSTTHRSEVQKRSPLWTFAGFDGAEPLGYSQFRGRWRQPRFILIVDKLIVNSRFRVDGSSVPHR